MSKTYNVIPDGLLVSGAATNNTGNGICWNDMNFDKFPPAKCYADTINSKLYNEAGIPAASSLAYLTGYLTLYNRDDQATGAAVAVTNVRNDLVVSEKNRSLYCSNCDGKTDVMALQHNRTAAETGNK